MPDRLMAMNGGAPAFHMILGLVEIALSFGIIFCAARWPRNALA